MIPRQRPRCKLSFAFTCTLQWVRGLLYWDPSNCSRCSQFKPSTLSRGSQWEECFRFFAIPGRHLCSAVICNSKSILCTPDLTSNNTEVIKGYYFHIFEHTQSLTATITKKTCLVKKQPFLSTGVKKWKCSDSRGSVLSSPTKVCR